MANRFLDLLATRPWLLADGATGTNYFQMGLQSGDAPELWNVDHPERVADLHRRFVEAGADIILTNSFGGSARRLVLHQAQDRVGELNAAAARIAREVADAAGRPVIVAGSMGPTGDLFEPLGPMTETEAAGIFEAQAMALKAGGADVMWLETMSSPEELRAAHAGASRTGLPVVATMSFDTNGKTMMGVSPGDYARLAHELPGDGLTAIGANCGTGANELVMAVKGMTEVDPEICVVAKANCGVPKFVEGEIVYDGTPELMGTYATIARDAGARIIGGCCGTSPEHLAAMRRSLETGAPGVRPSDDAIIAALGALVRPDAPSGESQESRRARKRRRA